MELGPVLNWLLHFGILGLVLSCAWSIGRLVRPGLFRAYVGSVLLGAGSLMLVPFLVAGLDTVGPRAFGELFYSLILLVFAVGICTLLLGWRYRTEAMIAFISPFVLILSLGAAVTELPSPGEASELPWWMGLTHGAAIFLAYACFATSFAAGATYLLQEASLRGVQFPQLIWRLPSLESSERIGFVAATAGVVLLTISVASGMVWQRSSGSLGEGWYRDPTVISGILTWGLYALLVVIRLAGWVRGRRLALAYVGAFTVVIVTFVGSAFIFQGGHKTFRAIEGADHHGLGGGGKRP